MVVMVGRVRATVLHPAPALTHSLDGPDPLGPDDLADAELLVVVLDELGDRVTGRAVGDHDVDRVAGAVGAAVSGAISVVRRDLGELRTHRAVHRDRVRDNAVLDSGAGCAGRVGQPAGVAAAGPTTAAARAGATGVRLGLGLGEVIGVDPAQLVVVDDLGVAVDLTAGDLDLRAGVQDLQQRRVLARTAPEVEVLGQVALLGVDRLGLEGAAALDLRLRECRALPIAAGPLRRSTRRGGRAAGGRRRLIRRHDLLGSRLLRRRRRLVLAGEECRCGTSGRHDADDCAET